MTRIQERARREVDLPDDGVTARALQRFALIGMTGELATKVGITGWKSGDVTTATIEALRLWVRGRDLPTRDEISASIRRVSDFVAAHPARFIPLPAPTTPLRTNHAGWVDAAFYYLTTDAWAEIHRGFDPLDVARQLQSRQLLITNEPGLKFRMGRQVSSRPRCYAVRRAGMASMPIADPVS